MSNLSTTYVPESRTYTYTEAHSLPTGIAPVPLPTSRTYVRPAKTHKGFVAGLKDGVNRMAGKAQRSWNEATDERFRRYFGFDFTEQLYGEFWGEVWTGGELIPCSAYVSTNYLCVLYKRKNHTTKDKVHIKATIALRDITFLQRAVCLPTHKGTAPVIQAIQDPAVKADSYIIYTSDGKMHQFCNFFNFDSFSHTLEWNWKTVKAGHIPSGSAAPFPQSGASIPVTGYTTRTTSTTYQGLNFPYHGASVHPTYGYQRLPRDKKAERFELKAVEWERRGNLAKAQKNREKALRHRQRTQPGYVAPVRAQTYYVDRANLFDQKAVQYQQWGMAPQATRYQQRSARLRTKHGLTSSSTSGFPAGSYVTQPTLVKQTVTTEPVYLSSQGR